MVSSWSSKVYNRDVRCPEEAAVYVKALQTLLRTVGSSDANMEQVQVAPALQYPCPPDVQLTF